MATEKITSMAKNGSSVPRNASVNSAVLATLCVVKGFCGTWRQFNSSLSSVKAIFSINKHYHKVHTSDSEGRTKECF